MASDEAASAFSISGRTYPQNGARQFLLPDALREISGLTFDAEQRLYGHDDEQGVIYQIDYQAGRVVNRFALAGGVRADFEGISWMNEQLYLITSNGLLYEFAAGRMNEQVPFTIHTEGLDCEVEGLSRSPDRSALIAACKNPAAGKKALHLYRWAPGQSRWESYLKVKRSAFDTAFDRLGVDRPKRFQPTGLTITPEGNLLLIAGPQKVLLEMTAEGKPLAAARLSANMHRQPEGIAMTIEGTLIIADEGDNKGARKSPGRLAVYEPAP